MTQSLLTSLLLALTFAPTLAIGLWLTASESFLGLTAARMTVVLEDPSKASKKSLNGIATRGKRINPLADRTHLNTDRTHSNTDRTHSNTDRTHSNTDRTNSLDFRLKRNSFRPRKRGLLEQALFLDSFILFSILIIGGCTVIFLLWSASERILTLIFALGTLMIIIHERMRKSNKLEEVRKLDQELPQFVQLMCLLITSGVTPLKSIDLLTRKSASLLACELRQVVTYVESGSSVPEAFDTLLKRVGTPGCRRFVTNLLVAIERGAPLVPVMVAMVRDSHSESKTNYMRAAGKSEIALMVPVVFLLLPISVLFALFPSMLQLQFFFA